MAYDDVLVSLGQFGRYQKRIYLLLCLPAISCALHKLAGVFLQAKVNHRCVVPIDNTTSYQLPDYIPENLLYPWDNFLNQRSSCLRFDANYTKEYFNAGIPPVETVRCSAWVYDNSIYQSTVVTEWDLVCDKAWLKATSDALLMVGIMIGSIVFGDLSDRFGRRPIFFISLVLQVIFGILMALSPNIWSFLLARMVLGSTTSGVFLVAYVIALEMVGPKKRMFAGVCFQYFFTAGFVLTAGFAYFIHDWRTLQIALTLPGVAFFCYWWFIPESVRWQLAKGKTEDAKKTLRAVAKENNVTLEDSILDELCSQTESERKNEITGDKPSMLDLFKHPNLRKKTLVIFALWFVNSGTYYGLSWNTSNLGGNEYLNFIISGCVEIPAYTFLIFTLDKWGRKIILSGSMIAAGICLVATVFVPHDMNWLNITLAMAGKLAITASYGTVYVFTSEQFPTVIRNVGLGAGSTVARFGGILAPYINILAEVWNPLPLLIFGALALTSGASSLLLPETLNKKLPETIEDSENFGKKIKQVDTEEENIALNGKIDSNLDKC